MATTRSFSDMLNEYLPNELLKEEFVKRDFLLSKVDKDDNWKGGELIVPFKAAGASSVAYGSLTASGDIAEDKHVRGSIAGHKEVWGSMKFNHRDLMEHDSVSEQSFLKILPGSIEDFMDHMKNVVSVNLLSGAHFMKLTAISTSAAGIVIVDRPDRVMIGQKVIVVTAGGTQTGYVKEIDMNTRAVKLVTARGGSTAVDFSADNAALGAKCYNDGANAANAAFLSLRGALLSATNGGDTNLHGVAKTLYPYLQAINVSGAAFTSTTLMKDIFNALTTVRQFGKGNPTDVVMSYKNFAACLANIELSKGAFNVAPGSSKASQFGWTELEVGSVTKGGLKLVAVQEADDDVIMIIDWRALKFHSNGFFKKRKNPDGKEYFETRDTTGYSYILDVCLFGELSVIRPSYCGIIHSVAI